MTACCDDFCATCCPECNDFDRPDEKLPDVWECHDCGHEFDNTPEVY